MLTDEGREYYSFEVMGCLEGVGEGFRQVAFPGVVPISRALCRITSGRPQEERESEYSTDEKHS
jgi:hypothetical protein